MCHVCCNFHVPLCQILLHLCKISYRTNSWCQQLEKYEDMIDHRSYSHNLSTKIKAWTGFEPVTTAIPVQCSTNWAIKPTGPEYVAALKFNSCHNLPWSIISSYLSPQFKYMVFHFHFDCWFIFVISSPTEPILILPVKIEASSSSHFTHSGLLQRNLFLNHGGRFKLAVLRTSKCFFNDATPLNITRI